MVKRKGQAVVYISRGRRSRVIGEAMAAGCKLHGYDILYKSAEDYKGTIDGDIALFYGYAEPLRWAFNTYRAQSKTTIFADLGYWGRLDGGRLSGYHKVTVNSTQPVAYFQKFSHGSKRFDKLNIDVKPIKVGGRNILIAGMSAKAAGVYGYAAQMFEKKLIYLLRQITDKNIVYRPKPSWAGATPLPGVGYSPGSVTLEQEFENTFLVATHHSNVAVDALVNGIPCNVNHPCVAETFNTELININTPRYPTDKERLRWLSDVAYVQWKVEEMANGIMWRHFKDEGLVV